ncbi:MAG TPA: substrate-binding domain-containing protein [bacterium]
MFALDPRIPPGGATAARRCFAVGVCTALITLLLPLAAPAPVSADGPHTVLRAYGPGGPHEVLKECAALYHKLYGETVMVFRGGPGTLRQKVALDGDLFYGGAEYMLEDFDRANPGLLDMRTVERLHPRRLGIVVRKGNPRGIRGLEDLRRTGIRVLQASFENVSGYRGGTAAGASRDSEEHTGTEALKAWRSHPEIDAWITYRSWHAVLAGEADFIEIAGDGALRFTPIALTTRTSHRQAAARFVAFLKSPEAERIFRQHGWD